MTKTNKLIVICPTPERWNKVLKKVRKTNGYNQHDYKSYNTESCIRIENNAIQGIYSYQSYQRLIINSLKGYKFITAEKYLNIKKRHQVFNI